MLLTGHTGFKGAWAAIWLKRLGAYVTGFALPPETDPSLWREVGSGLLDQEFIGDLRDPETVLQAAAAARPSVVLHMAAQALVRESYRRPVETFGTNVMGTVHLLQALRSCTELQSVLVITTDKVYANSDEERHFVEQDRLGGDDPYSAAKAAAELVTASYAKSFFESRKVRVATARAGNVIGGGDWSADRLIPDVWRAATRGESVILRYPQATRPWQHVLEPLSGYIMYLQALTERREVPLALNFGPSLGKSVTVAEVAEAMAEALGARSAWRKSEEDAPREMAVLSLDSSCAATALGWQSRLNPSEATEWTARWYAARDEGRDPMALCHSQIDRYEALL